MRPRGFILVLALAAGCGDPGPRLVPVSGRLSLDGAPLAHKTIQFVPESGTPGGGAGATTDAEGRYSLIATRGGALADMRGTCPGKYKVVVAEPMIPIGADPKAAPVEGEPAPTIGLPVAVPGKKGRPGVPGVYSSKDSTPLAVTVAERGGEILLELKSRGK